MAERRDNVISIIVEVHYVEFLNQIRYVSFKQLPDVLIRKDRPCSSPNPLRNISKGKYLDSITIDLDNAGRFVFLSWMRRLMSRVSGSDYWSKSLSLTRWWWWGGCQSLLSSAPCVKK